MSFLLKIVEGPNKGAEIALVEGLCISVGKADDCDIILADPTLPDSSLQIEAAADGVSIEVPGEGRRHLESYHVMTIGTTAFAVGSAEAAWPSLVWPKKDEPPAAEPPEPAKEEEKKPEEPKPEGGKPEDGGRKNKRGLWLVVAIAVVLLLLLLGVLGWIFRGRIAAMLPGGGGDSSESAAEETISPLDALVEKYSLARSENDGVVSLAGDFKTRADRLAATAEAYALQPGIVLDFADEESLKGAVEDTLALLGENELRVSGITNRVAVMTGRAIDLRRTLEAIAVDVPKLANVDCSDVAASDASVAAVAARNAQAARSKSKKVDFPVCGIVTNPYPCLVMSNGMRMMEGASIGENVIVKIDADQVVITNSAGRVVWKP